MKVIYVIGPYRAAGEWQVVQNIRRAEALALDVWKMGAACICPHKNTALFGGAAADEVWLKGDLEILARCDAVICVDGWQNSIGSREEVKRATGLGLPVFESKSELKAWLDGPEASPKK